MRRKLKEGVPLVARDTAEFFRTRIKAVELESERLEQEALFAMIPSIETVAAPSVEAAARANVLAYEQALAVAFTPGPLEILIAALVSFARRDAGDHLMSERGYADLHDHIDRLDEAGLLRRIDAPINKDTEMHPLVRWQFRGGIAGAGPQGVPVHQHRRLRGTALRHSGGGRRARGECRDLPHRHERRRDDEIGPRWAHAIANPVAPRVVERAPCHDIVITGAALEGPGRGLAALPIPISTPGFDAAPYLTATCVITRDPDTGMQNIGTYRGHLKSADPARHDDARHRSRAGGFDHWQKHRDRGTPMPVAIVVGCPPVVAYQGPQKLPQGVDEITRRRRPRRRADQRRARRAPSTSWCRPRPKLVIEGYVDPEYLEPEGPFGEFHGYVALEDYNLTVEVTAITRRRDAVIPSIISQVTPSESSVVKRLAYEPLLSRASARQARHQGHPARRAARAAHQPAQARDPAVRARHAALGDLARAQRDVDAAGDRRQVHRRGRRGHRPRQCRCGLLGDVLSLQSHQGHPCRALSRARPWSAPGGPEPDSAMLIDATMKQPMPPLALPKREYMENAKTLWERLGLPPLRPEMPWYGYSLGDWDEEWDDNAAERRAGRLRWTASESYRQRRRKGIAPNTPTRAIEGTR